MYPDYAYKYCEVCKLLALEQYFGRTLELSERVCPKNTTSMEWSPWRCERLYADAIQLTMERICELIPKRD